jgi:dihydropteroate synthase
MKDKDTSFHEIRRIGSGDRSLSLEKPLVMGILNITPDSFYDGGMYNDTSAAVKRVASMLEQGADLIDVGAASTRPGAALVSYEEEAERLFPVLRLLNQDFPGVFISVDTSHPEIVKESVEKYGAFMINDISGGTLHPQIIPVVAGLKVPFVVMHMQGNPQNMQKNPEYKDVVREVSTWLEKQILLLRDAGVSDIIVDPGFGFGKNLEHNYRLLNELELFTRLNCPLMVGLSRKSMVYRLLNTGPENALNGTSVLHAVALLKGADILRVHDVKEAREVVSLLGATRGQEKA